MKSFTGARRDPVQDDTSKGALGNNTAVPLSDLTFLKRAVPERNRHELYHHIASNLRGWVDHLEMAGNRRLKL